MVNSKFEWTRHDTLGIADFDCVRCHGLGLAGGRIESTQPCPCVLSAIFRECFAKFRDLATQKPLARRGIGWSRRDEEYMADFIAISRRALVGRGLGRTWDVFRAHFLLGADTDLCVRRLGIDRGTFHANVVEIKKRVGRALRETQPHALFPIDEYFRPPNAKY